MQVVCIAKKLLTFAHVINFSNNLKQISNQMKESVFTYYSVTMTPTIDGAFPHRNFSKLKNARKCFNQILKHFEDQGKAVKVENFQSGEELLETSLYFESYNLEEELENGSTRTLTYVQIRREFLIIEDGGEEE